MCSTTTYIGITSAYSYNTDNITVIDYIWQWLCVDYYLHHDAVNYF
jgi:hypothetical protein